MLAKQIEQRGFDRGNRVNRGAQVKCLCSTASRIAIRKLLLRALHRAAVSADRLANHEFACIFERLTNLLAARYFADANMTGAVREDQQVARKKWAMRSAQI